MKNIKITQVALALLTSATIMLTTGSCASQNNEKKNNVATSNMDNTTTYIDETEILTQKEYVTNKEGQTYTSPNGKVVTEVKTAVATKPRVIVNSDGSTTIVTVPSSNKINNNVTKQITTKKVTTTKKPSTTKKPTTTKKPVTATSLTANNINNIDVFKTFSSQILANNRGSWGDSWTYIYDEEYYKISVSGGENCSEFEMSLTLLNRDYVNDSTLKELFSSKSLDELKRYTNFIRVMPTTLENNHNKNNWTDVTINDSIANQLNRIDSSYMKYLKGNKGDFEEIFLNDNTITDPFVRRYLSSCAINIVVYHDVSDNFLDKSYSLYQATTDEMNSIATDIYNKSRNKVKTYK